MTEAPSFPRLALAGAVLPTVGGGADAILMEDGVISAVGRWSEIRRDIPPATEVRDLAGATILPGLGDAHVHFAATGFLQTAVDCSGLRDRRSLLDRIAAEARKCSAGELILGLRMPFLDSGPARMPSAEELEAAAPGNPVYLRHVTGHASVANRAALALLDLEAGQAGVELDSAGCPTGSLIAQATQVATARMYRRYAEQVGYRRAFRAAAERAARAGCTVVHALDDLEAVRELVAMEAELPIRVVPFTQTLDLDAVRALGLPRIGGCHACALDGDFDMHTAALLEPYEGCADSCGVLYHEAGELQEFACAAHRVGMQLAFHAVGDRAVEQALDAFERAQSAFPRPDARHRIEHAQLINAQQMARARRLGVVLSLQPAFNHHWGHETYPVWIGTRAREVDPLASLAAAGLSLAGGSDSTVTPLEPLLGVHAAVNHSRAEERLEVGEALRMFTHGVAYSSFDESRRGAIAVGYEADLSVVAANPLEHDPARIAEIRPLMTVVRGGIRWEA